MPSESSTWSPPASTERRNSNSSDGSACSGYSKATSDSADFLATRAHTASVLPGKPAANPLQFIKVGPADLGTRAREQLRRAELAKRTEPARLERQEDWQSNLDNWKSSRRKRVEHIIERCVEVKRMENETNQPRGKSKTFNEMMEERAGRRRRNPLALYTDDEAHDLSDLGIGTSSTKSSLSEDCDTHSLASDGMDLDKIHSDMDNMCNLDGNRKTGSSANEYDTCTTATISSPEPEEYTYEGAIEGYKSRIISTTNSNIVKTAVNNSDRNDKDKSPEKLNGDIYKIRTSVSNKIEQKLTSFQLERSNDLKNNNPKKDLPKVDIHKRREHFERENSQETHTNKPKLPDITNKKTIKERLSHLEKFTEESQLVKSTSDLTKLPTEVKPLKDRLSCLGKVTSTEPDKVKRLSNGDLAYTKSLKERLSSFKTQVSEEEAKLSKTGVKEVSMSLKERLSCLDAAKNKEIPKISVENDIMNVVKSSKSTVNNSDKTDLLGLEDQMQSFCRSLDSLDINEQTSQTSFERAQSLEDFDCAEMQSNAIPSDIETEDSGIHTARDSCAPADDIADLTQVASPIEEPMIEVSEYDSSNEDLITVETKIDEPTETKSANESQIKTDLFIEEVSEHDNKTDNSDSTSNYTQALSHPDEFTVTEELTEIQIDKEDEDTLKSLENQDSSVIDALELAFKELDSEESVDITMNNNTAEPPKAEAQLDEKIEELVFNNNKNAPLAPLYENIDIFGQNHVVDTGTFPLDMPSKVLEPPKEKPPPPPPEDSPDDELLGNGNFKHNNSARRIKKEIRNKRSSFLGIEGDDSYLDVDLTLAPRPDLTSFLQEATKIEKLLYKKTLSHDMDAKLRDSRDSGVDIDRGPSAEAWYKGSSPETSAPHSRQNSEPYTQITVTSDEEEATKKQEDNFTKSLTDKLTDIQTNDDTKIEHLDKKIQQQQVCVQAVRINDGWSREHYDDVHTKEVLRFERELLQLEQEELRRQRENLIRDQNRIIQKSVQDVSKGSTPEKHQAKGVNNYRHSMPNLLLAERDRLQRAPINDNLKRKPFVSEEHIESHFGVEESRKVLYDDKKYERRAVPNVMRPTQPVLPPKPKSRESIEREITMSTGGCPPALMTNSEWLQSRNPPRQKPNNYNYNNHWLVQLNIVASRNRRTAAAQQQLPQERRPVRPDSLSRGDPAREDKLLSVGARP
ncbi:unnamed protein product [Leptidea sinapis]|uniref:DUF4757 domain-containing protein n=1 Tax=Leptidea sinapis TaxID=189913 RepID=A0A5E4QRP6_9NEOP|nr:unnamed protein product [Leptidea sinapis]